MEKITIEAFNGVGEKAVKAGEREVEKPTSFQELVDNFDEAEILKGFWKSYVIDVQRELRATTNGPTMKAKVNSIIEQAKKEKAAGDPTLYDKCVELGVIS